MDTYKERENALFARWKAACVAQEGDDASDNFVSDGLLFRGAIEQVCGCWEQRSGHETELWDNSPCRLLILTKDATRASNMDDIRIETARKNHTGTMAVASRSSFHRNLTLWSYALLNALQGREVVSYDHIPHWEALQEHYATAPIARVNCKKLLGESSIDDAALKFYIKRYACFLEEQIALYDANIILCCGGNGIIKDFVKAHYLPDLVQFSSDAWVYYSPSTRKVVIDSYHPSYARSLTQTALFYEQMMADVKAFLLKYPTYRKH